MRAPRTAPLGALLAILCIAAAPAVAKSVGYPDPAGYCQEASNELDPRDLGTVPLDPLPPGVSERFVRLAGVRTPLLEAGAASSRLSVVFVHGNLGSSRDFAGMMSASRSLGLRLLAFDLPGFGRAE